MMNKHKLESTVRSIQHYEQEIAKLEAALGATQSTRNDLIKSLSEYFPFSVGDIITNGTKVFKVSTDLKNVVCVGEKKYDGRLGITVNIKMPDHWGNFESMGTYFISLNELPSFVLVKKQ
jgi:hypothetical protein